MSRAQIGQLSIKNVQFCQSDHVGASQTLRQEKSWGILLGGMWDDWEGGWSPKQLGSACNQDSKKLASHGFSGAHLCQVGPADRFMGADAPPIG